MIKEQVQLHHEYVITGDCGVCPHGFKVGERVRIVEPPYGQGYYGLFRCVSLDRDLAQWVHPKDLGELNSPSKSERKRKIMVELF